jgi:hypothetical protein
MASALRKALVERKVHADVLKFCRAELLVDNYFHAVFEATKSVAEKLRQKTGLGSDGAHWSMKPSASGRLAVQIKELTLTLRSFYKTKRRPINRRTFSRTSGSSAKLLCSKLTREIA